LEAAFAEGGKFWGQGEGVGLDAQGTRFGDEVAFGEAD
jgi:hypothetical protein